jgi:hypothetical protein
VDLTRGVGYRGFALNSLQFDAETRDMVGCEITSVEYGHVLGVGYDEKRALGEGRDASDVFLDRRLISLAGNVYGRSRAEAMDQFRGLSEALSPVDAYGEDPGQKGFLPLDFWTPTLDTYFQPSGLIHQMLLARPLATPGARFDSDRHGGPDSGALAIPWNAQLAARNPRILNVATTTTAIDVGSQGSGTVRNRGTRPAVIEVYLVIPTNVNGTTNPGTLSLNIGGAFNYVWTLPRADHPVVLQYDTDSRVTEYDDDLRMDLIDFISGTPHGHLQPGQHSYSWKVNAARTLLPGSYFRFRDTWA